MFIWSPFGLSYKFRLIWVFSFFLSLLSETPWTPLSTCKAVMAPLSLSSKPSTPLWVGFWHDNQAKKSRVWRTCGRGWGWGLRANPPSRPSQAQLLSRNATQIRNIGALVPPQYFWVSFSPFLDSRLYIPINPSLKLVRDIY